MQPIRKCKIKETSRIDGAKLMARTFDIDVLRCPYCDGRMRLVEVMPDKAHATWWLAKRGLSDEPAPRPRRPVPPEQPRRPFAPQPRPVAKQLTPQS